MAGSSWTNQIVTQVIIVGPNSQELVYSPTIGAGHLIASISSQAATDPFGNAVLEGIAAYDNGVAATLVAGGINVYNGPASGAGPWTQTVTFGETLAGEYQLFGFTGTDMEIWGVGNINGQVLTIYPSGDTTGATDLANINNALASTTLEVHLVASSRNFSGATPYYINGPIIMQQGARLSGGQWWSASGNDNYSAGPGSSGGALIIMVPGFTGSAAISYPDPGGTQMYGVDLSGITIEGFELSSGTIYGVEVVGAWGACFMRGVCIHRTPSDCFHAVPGATGHIPDEWIIQDCKFTGSRNGYGAYAQDLADSSWDVCNFSENALDGCYIDYGVNTRFNNCKFENNGANGFHHAGLGNNQIQYLTGCSTHINKNSGFYFDNNGPSGGGTDSTVVLTGCMAQQDGQASASGTYAGFLSSGSKARVIGTGCVAQIDATGAFPPFGAWEGNTSFGMCFTGSLLQGATPTHDDGSNTHALVNQEVVAF